MRATPTRLLSIPLVLAVSACGGDGGEAGMEESGMAEEPAMEQPAMEEATLNALNESGVTGTVSIEQAGDSMVVSVEATGLAGAGEYASHIHQGTCAAPGAVATPLNSVAANAMGVGRASTTVATAGLESGQSYLVMVHGQDGALVACAELPVAPM